MKTKTLKCETVKTASVQKRYTPAELYPGNATYCIVKETNCFRPCWCSRAWPDNWSCGYPDRFDRDIEWWMPTGVTKRNGIGFLTDDELKEYGLWEEFKDTDPNNPWGKRMTEDEKREYGLLPS